MKRIEDFYLEEVILYQIQQHIMELEESDKLLRGEKDKAQTELDRLKAECKAAEDKVRDYGRMKVHENFAVLKLTPEIMDEYVEGVEVLPGNEVRISWK